MMEVIGSVPRPLQDNVYHFCHPPTSPALLIVDRLLGSTKGGPIIQWALSYTESWLCAEGPDEDLSPYVGTCNVCR